MQGQIVRCPKCGTKLQIAAAPPVSAPAPPGTPVGDMSIESARRTEEGRKRKGYRLSIHVWLIVAGFVAGLVLGAGLTLAVAVGPSALLPGMGGALLGLIVAIPVGGTIGALVYARLSSQHGFADDLAFFMILAIVVIAIPAVAICAKWLAGLQNNDPPQGFVLVLVGLLLGAGFAVPGVLGLVRSRKNGAAASQQLR
jgi:hypothetical protein